MKNLILLLITVFCLGAMASCGSSPYKKRKGCKGNGSWYGKRNLGQKVQQPTVQDLYVWMPTSEEVATF